uniref:Uncharacterized protein n=1 Tax=Chrysotila carterae TaxID=13221 RepID=A0A7S4BCB6_CHRCT
MTTSMKSFSGAIINSCFLVRTRRKVRSFCGSRSRTTERLFCASCDRLAAYCVVTFESIVDLTHAHARTRTHSCTHAHTLTTHAQTQTHRRAPARTDAETHRRRHTDAHATHAKT